MSLDKIERLFCGEEVGSRGEMGEMRKSLGM